MTVDDELTRIVGRLRDHDFPALGIQSAPMPDVIRGNDDLADTCTWSPPQHEPQRPPQVYPLPPEIER